MIDYLTEKTTYYKILSLINNNYELFENLTDSLVFDVSSQSDEINYYLNENELQNLPVIPIKGHWERITDTVKQINSNFEHHFSKYFIERRISIFLGGMLARLIWPPNLEVASNNVTL